MKELRNQTNSSSDSMNQISATTFTTSVIDVDNSDVFLENYLEKSLWKDKDRGISLSDEEFEDEEEFEEMERFESRYNFRFEELQAGVNNSTGDNTDDNKILQVMGHSRDIQGSLRRG